MAEGRRLHGDGVENLQDYVEERITYGTDSDEFAEANQQLEQQSADLNRGQQVGANQQRGPDVGALEDEAQLDTDRMRPHGDAQLESSAGSTFNPEAMPPEAEARNRVSDGPGMGGQSGVGNNMR